MNLDLKGKNALVCGSSKGIGKAAAIELAALGANITLVARSAEKMADILREMSMTPPQDHDFLVADFSQPAELRKKIKGLVSGKPIHILINNTGGPPGGAILDAKPEAFLDAYQQHLICNHILTQAVVPSMKKANYGRIINIISTSVKVPINGLGVSNTTRGAVASWSKTMANELGIYGITVNNVLPGFTMTGRLESIINNRAKKANSSYDDAKNIMENSVPMKRFATPREIGAAVAFLASPAAAYINGVNLPVDGGRTPSM